MFNILASLTKAAIVAVVTPVAIAIDVVKIPARAYNNESPFSTTEKVLGSVSENYNNATYPEK